MAQSVSGTVTLQAAAFTGQLAECLSEAHPCAAQLQAVMASAVHAILGDPVLAPAVCIPILWAKAMLMLITGVLPPWRQGHLDPARACSVTRSMAWV